MTIVGPEHALRKMNWKKETELRKSLWPNVARRCPAKLDDETHCEHLVGHPKAHAARSNGEYHFWSDES